MSAPSVRVPCAVLGATGYIGQHFARLLADHPWFGTPLLFGSGRTRGARFEEFWQLGEEPPPSLTSARVREGSPARIVAEGVRVVFSALPSSTAGPIETELARRGVHVFTNAADHRMDPAVPLLVPEVNPEHLGLLGPRGKGMGVIVADPNCTTAGLVVALKPVWGMLEPSAVHVATYQALSGAGIPGVASLAIQGNVVPFIAREEEKVVEESHRILGALRRRRVFPVRASFSVQCVRVPVRDGHLEAVTIVARRRPTERALLEAWERFDPLADRTLPTAPHPVTVLRTEPDRPQPIFDLWAGRPSRARGMAVTIGRVRWTPPYLRFFCLSHNAVRGGAGGSVLNAELTLQEGRLPGLSGGPP